MTTSTTNELPPPTILTNSGQGRKAMSDLMKAGIVVSEELANFKADEDSLSTTYKFSSAVTRGASAVASGVGQMASGASKGVAAYKSNQAAKTGADPVKTRRLENERAAPRAELNGHKDELTGLKRRLGLIPDPDGGLAAPALTPAERTGLEGRVRDLETNIIPAENRRLASLTDQITDVRAASSTSNAALLEWQVYGELVKGLIDIGKAGADINAEVDSALSQRVDAASRSAGSNAEQATQIVSSAGQASKADAGVIKGR